MHMRWCSVHCAFKAASAVCQPETVSSGGGYSNTNTSIVSKQLYTTAMYSLQDVLFAVHQERAEAGIQAGVIIYASVMLPLVKVPQLTASTCSTDSRTHPLQPCCFSIAHDAKHLERKKRTTLLKQTYRSWHRGQNKIMRAAEDQGMLQSPQQHHVNMASHQLCYDVYPLLCCVFFLITRHHQPSSILPSCKSHQTASSREQRVQQNAYLGSCDVSLHHTAPVSYM